MEFSSLKFIRDVVKVRKNVLFGRLTVELGAFAFSRRVASGAFAGLFLIEFWKSCGKMSLGVSWWKM